MNYEKIFVVDWSKVEPYIIEGLQDGSIWLRDGVAINNKGTVKWLPLIEQLIDSTKNIEEVLKQIQSAQTLQLTATALSTGLILGAIVIQTMYLANKIDKLQQKIDLISQDLHSQNVIYFMGQLSEYFGLIESARVLLLNKELVDESGGIAEQYMGQLAAKRNELLSLIDNLIHFVDGASERHGKLMFDFVNMMLDLLPKSICLEVQLYERYGKFKMADHIRDTAKKSYDNVLNNYKAWCNHKAKSAIKGESPKHSALIENQNDLLKQLFDSEINQSLLSTRATPILQQV